VSTFKALSKDTISVEFFYTRPPDGKSLAEEPSSPSARSAENFLGRPARRQQKGPGRCARPDPLVQFDTERMWSKLATPPTVTLTFPNIAHKYWDNYRLTKEFYVRPAKD
jgi:hypothetical protein